jgi:hypothetical protein
VPLTLSHAGEDHVRAGTDERGVAAEVGPHGERPPDRVVRLAGGQLVDNREHRGRVRDVVDDGRQERRDPEDEEGRAGQRAAGDRLDRPGDGIDQPDLDHPRHEHEQPDEEEEGGPLDLPQDLVRALPRHDHEHDGPGERDRRGLEMQGAVEQKADQCQAEHHQRPPKKSRLGDHRPLVEVEEARPQLGIDPKEVAEQPASGHEVHGEQHDGQRRHDEQELAEVEAGGAADEDVRGVSDEGRGTADVRGEDLAHQERKGVHPQPCRQEQRDGPDQHDGRDVVEERGGDRRDEAEDHEDAIRIAARDSSGAHGQPPEDAGLPDDAGQDHHPGQEEDDVEVDLGEGLILADDAEQHHEHAAGKGGQRLVDTLGGDEQIGPGEDRQADDDLGRHGRWSPELPGGSRRPAAPLARTQTISSSSWST